MVLGDRVEDGGPDLAVAAQAMDEHQRRAGSAAIIGQVGHSATSVALRRRNDFMAELDDSLASSLMGASLPPGDQDGKVIRAAGQDRKPVVDMLPIRV
ncbi:hypothetical protein GCM10010112_88920 [Actinoplanes lobatus]|nr:hypothetical protein GCM10010112_88920 [Actinoplanes lobatus]